jgi:hypothetical protein
MAGEREPRVIPITFNGYGELVELNGEKVRITPEEGGTPFVSIVNGYQDTVSPDDAAVLGATLADKSNFRLVEGPKGFGIEPEYPHGDVVNRVTIWGLPRREIDEVSLNGYVAYDEDAAALYVKGIHGVPLTDQEAEAVRDSYKFIMGAGVRVTNENSISVHRLSQVRVLTVFDARGFAKVSDYNPVPLNSPTAPHASRDVSQKIDPGPFPEGHPRIATVRTKLL